MLTLGASTHIVRIEIWHRLQVIRVFFDIFLISNTPRRQMKCFKSGSNSNHRETRKTMHSLTFLSPRWLRIYCWTVHVTHNGLYHVVNLSRVNVIYCNNIITIATNVNTSLCSGHYRTGHIHSTLCTSNLFMYMVTSCSDLFINQQIDQGLE